MADSAPIPTAPLILLVGMHRSGTSLLGSLLPPLGVPLPGELIAADRHNPEGYYERSDITALQEELLIDLGRWWPSAAGTEPLPADWLAHPASRRAAAALQQLLAAEQHHQKGPWAIKDPRTSLLLPLWRQVAAALHLPLRLVLSVRDPAEVMVSLLQRDAAATGMTANRAQQLWWHHNRELLRAAQDLPLLVIDYGAWFEPRRRQRQLRQLAQFCLQQPASPSAMDIAASRIQPGHRRSRRRASQLPQPIHPWLRQLYRRLRQLAAAGSPPRQRDQLQHWLSPCSRSLPPAAPPGPWFDPQHYRRQTPPLAAWLPAWPHYCLVGWRRGRPPHPLFAANHYRHAAHQRGLSSAGPPLRHFLRSGLDQGLPACDLAEPRWAATSPARRALLENARLEGLHPWGQAALAVCHGQQPAAISQLRQWLHAGLSAADLAAIAAAPAGQWGGSALAQGSPPPLPPQMRLVCSYGDLRHWQVHAWMQYLPLAPDTQLNPEAEATVHLLLGSLPQGPEALRLIPLAGSPWVFASEASAIPLLRRLGIHAQLLDLTGPTNGWLDRAHDSHDGCRQLGLPPPQALALQAQVLCLGSGGPTWEQQLTPPLWCWPGFEAVAISSPEQARLLASWLNACNRAGLQLVRLDPTAAEAHLDGWRALQPPADPPRGWLPPQRFLPPLPTTAELLGELAWRATGQPAAIAPATPAPAHQLLHEHQAGAPASAAVCISLYNYGHRIGAALESVQRQTLVDLELIVVDDGSSDDGPGRVRQWLREHQGRFSRTVLAVHQCNGGLAAARNTAFGLAQAPWCFVLDADNQLEPEAVEACLALGLAAPADVAVVHPLIELVIEQPSGASETVSAALPAAGLLSHVSWQRQHFLERNALDAMALVRRSAWERVQGYSHIPGGWEDYDFWCKLIEAGYCGILCPQRLARYHRHSNSMLATSTHHRLRQVSRLLQQRHPWLCLHLATEPPL